jgi:hypothetical protein
VEGGLMAVTVARLFKQFFRRRPYCALVDAEGDFVLRRRGRELLRLPGFPTTEPEIIDFIGQTQECVFKPPAIGRKQINGLLGAAPRLFARDRSRHRLLSHLGFANLQPDQLRQFFSKAHRPSLRRKGRA